MSCSWLWDTRRGSACRKCMTCSFHCIYPYWFFLWYLLHDFWWERQNKVDDLFSTLYLTGLCFCLRPPGKAVFKYVKFLIDFSLSGFSCKSELWKEVLSFRFVSSLKGSINYVSERKGTIFWKKCSFGKLLFCLSFPFPGAEWLPEQKFCHCLAMDFH